MIHFSSLPELLWKECNIMKYIHKKPAPPELVAYSKTSGASYLKLRKKHDLYKIIRLSLADEQGYICCYCGQRISGFDDNTQIENIWPKGTPIYEKMQLDYENNLIATCDGGKKLRQTDHSIPFSDCHCDTPKGDTPIPIHPLMPNCEEKFLFEENGEIIGIGSDAEVTIEILNLSSPILKNKRKAAIASLTMFPCLDWKNEYDRLNQKNSNGEYTEFCFVLRKYIEFFHQEALH